MTFRSMKSRPTKHGLAAALAITLAPMLAVAGPVDINAADAPTLARELNGVGESRARAIVEFREKNGRFASAEDLLKVSGIGPQVLQLNRENIRLGASPDAVSKSPSRP
jgi:competence protein ComEA